VVFRESRCWVLPENRDTIFGYVNTPVPEGFDPWFLGGCGLLGGWVHEADLGVTREGGTEGDGAVGGRQSEVSV